MTQDPVREALKHVQGIVTNELNEAYYVEPTGETGELAEVLLKVIKSLGWTIGNRKRFGDSFDPVKVLRLMHVGPTLLAERHQKAADLLELFIREPESKRAA